MFDLWKQPLTDEEKSALIARAADEIRKRKLHAAATLFLESHKPLAHLTSQMMLGFSPFIIPLLGFDFVNDYSRLLADRDAVETLIDRLAEGEPQRNDMAC